MKKLVPVLAALVGAVAAHATPITNPTTGLAAPATTLTFNEIVLANNAAFNSQYAGLGIESASGLFYNGCQNACVTTPPNGTHPELSNFTGANTTVFTGSSTLNFTSAIDGAAFQFASNGGTFTFTAYLDNAVVESFTGSGSNWGYFGFSNVTLDQINISSPSAFLLDNLQMGATVPEPASLGLVGLGLAGLAWSRRRKS